MTNDFCTIKAGRVNVARSKEIDMPEVPTKKDMSRVEAPVAKSMKVTPEYEAAVTRFADEHKNQKFLNDSHHHASLLAELMIGRATEHDDVLIYSKSLPQTCFGDALEHSKSRNIRIVLDDALGQEEIKKLSLVNQERIKHKVLTTNDGAHFWIAGDSFRLEMDHDKAKAVANFNDPEAVQVLRARFEKLWSSIE